MTAPRTAAGRDLLHRGCCTTDEEIVAIEAEAVKPLREALSQVIDLVDKARFYGDDHAERGLRDEIRRIIRDALLASGDGEYEYEETLADQSYLDGKP